MHAGNKRRSGTAAGNYGRPRLGSAEVQTRIRSGDDVEWPAGREFDDRRQRDVSDEMLPDVVAASSRSGLEDRAGDPAMALVVDGIGFLQKWAAAVLRLERGLQVRAVVDGVRPGVAGKQFEAFGNAFLHINGERVVPGTGIGELR